MLVCRGLADDTTDVEDKQHFLLEAFSQIQMAVSQQEVVVLHVQTLLPPQSEVGTVRMDGWVGGWTDGWVDLGMDGGTDR